MEGVQSTVLIDSKGNRVTASVVSLPRTGWWDSLHNARPCRLHSAATPSEAL